MSLRTHLNRRTANVIALLLASGAALLYSLNYDLGNLGDPGPGMWPGIGSAVMVVGSVTILLPGRDSLDEYVPYTRNIRYIAYALLVAVGWLFLTQYVGLIIATFSFFYVWLTFIGRESQKVAIIIGAVSAITVYILFDVLLRAPFPEGFLERLIGL